MRLNHTMKFYITGTRRGLGKRLSELYPVTDNLETCDIFINCKHDGFSQVDLLYKAAKLNKRIINIGSAASDWTKGYKDNFKYGIEKHTLRMVNDQLFWQGVNTTILNFGYFDTERSSHVDKPKMTLDYVIEIIDWVIFQPHRIKEMTLCA
jgi:hypothetical protein